MRSYVHFIILIVALAGCSDTTSKGKSASNSTTTNNGNNANNTNNTDECEPHEVRVGERCAPQESVSVFFDATTGLPPSFGNLYICKDVLVDEEAAAEFVSWNEVVAEVGDCRVTRILIEKNPTGYETQGGDFGEVFLSGGGVETMVDEVVPEDELFPGCLTTSMAVDFEYEENYRIEAADGASSPAFTVDIQIPAQFDTECISPVPGEDFEVSWTPVGAEEVEVELLGSDSTRIECTTSDSGQFVVPAEATEFLGGDRNYLSIRGFNMERLVIDGVAINATVSSWTSCFESR